MTRPRNLDLLLAAAEAGVLLVPTPDGGLRFEGERAQAAKVERLVSRRRRHLARALAEIGGDPELAHATALCNAIRRIADRGSSGRWEYSMRLKGGVARLFGLRIGMLPTRRGAWIYNRFLDEVPRWFPPARNVLDHCWFFRPACGRRRARVIASQPYAEPDDGLDAALLVAGWRLVPTGGFPSWWYPGRTHLLVFERTDTAAELWRERWRLRHEAYEEARRDRFLARLLRP